MKITHNPNKMIDKLLFLHFNPVSSTFLFPEHIYINSQWIAQTLQCQPPPRNESLTEEERTLVGELSRGRRRAGAAVD